MNERDMAQKNEVLRYRVGSHLYGTNVATSDEDFCGVFIADLEYYLGFNKVEECDLSKVSKLDTGKNAPDAVDCKLFEIRKFFRLAMENNPNVIEQLFIPEQHIVNATPFGREILALAPLFPWKGCYDKFKGYAKSQKHKMALKPENRTEILKAIAWVKGNEESIVRSLGDVNRDFLKLRLDRFTAELEVSKIAKDEKTHLKIGDLNCCTSWTIIRLKGVLEDRLEKMSHRAEMWEKYGYDTKFAMHLLRLLIECEWLLETGKLQFPLDQHERHFLLNVRNGQYSLEQVLEYADSIEKRVDAAYSKSKLPAHPRYDEIQFALMDIVKRFHGIKL